MANPSNLRLRASPWLILELSFKTIIIIIFILHILGSIGLTLLTTFKSGFKTMIIIIFVFILTQAND